MAEAHAEGAFPSGQVGEVESILGGPWHPIIVASLADLSPTKLLFLGCELILQLTLQAPALALRSRLHRITASTTCTSAPQSNPRCMISCFSLYLKSAGSSAHDWASRAFSGLAVPVGRRF